MLALVGALLLVAPSTAFAEVVVDATGTVPTSQDGSHVLTQDADGVYQRVLGNFEIPPIDLRFNVSIAVSGAAPSSPFSAYLVYRIPGTTTFYNDGNVFPKTIQASGGTFIGTPMIGTVPLGLGTYDVSVHWDAQVTGTFGNVPVSGETPKLFSVAIVAGTAQAPTPPTATLLGVPEPVQANTALISADLPSVTITDQTPSTSYGVTWTFSAPIALIDGAATAVTSFTETIAAPGTTAPFAAHFGDGDPAAQKSLAFSTQGVFTVSATVTEGGTTVAATSNVGDNTIVVFDPFSSVTASGKGTLNVSTTKQPKINFSLSYKNGAGKGNLVYNSPSEGVSFSATSVAYLTATGSAAVSEGSGTLNNVDGWHYKLNVDGSTNAFQLVLTGPGTTYSVGPATLSADKKGDITVTSPPNG